MNNHVELSKGETFTPEKNNADFYQATMDAPGWGSRVECYGKTERDANDLRDSLLSCYQQFDQVSRQRDALLNAFRELKAASSGSFSGWHAKYEKAIAAIQTAIEQSETGDAA